MAKTVLEDPEVAGIVFADDQGKPVAQATAANAKAGGVPMTRSTEVRSPEGTKLGSITLMLNGHELATEQVRSLGVLALVCALAVTAPFLVGRKLASSITRPILEVADLLDDLSAGQGDLTARLDPGSVAEVARLARGFNRFVANIQGMMQQVAALTGKLSADTVERNGGMAAMASPAKAIATRAEDQLGNVHQATTKVGGIAASYEDHHGTVERALQVSNQAQAAAEWEGTSVDQATAASAECMAAIGAQSRAQSQDSREVVGAMAGLGEIADQNAYATEAMASTIEQATRTLEGLCA